MQKITKYFLLLVAVMIAVSTIATAKRNTLSPDVWQANQRKAGYIAISANGKNNRDTLKSEYVQMILHAHAVDSENDYLGYQAGKIKFLMSDTSELWRMKKYIDAHPDKKIENEEYSKSMLMLGNNDEGIRVLERLSSYYPKDVMLKLHLADIYNFVGRTDDAINIYNNVISGEEFPRYYTSAQLASIYMQRNDTTMAEKSLLDFYKAEPHNSLSSSNLVNFYFSINLPDSALHYLNKYAEIEGAESAPVKIGLCEYYKAIGDSARLDSATYQMLMSPEVSAETKTNELVKYIRNAITTGSDTARAENLLKSAIEGAPHNTDFHELYSDFIYSVKNDVKGAAEELSYALDVEPERDDLWKRLVQLRFMANDYDGSIDAANVALSFNPNSYELYPIVAGMYEAMKDPQNAIKVAKLALDSIVPADNVKVRMSLSSTLADALFMVGDTAKAFEQYEELLKYDPNNSNVLNNYAYFLSLSNERLDDALRMSGQSLKIDPDNPVNLDTYAWILFKKKDFKLALFYIEKAINAVNDNNGQSDGNNAELFDHYGDILFMNGEPDQALIQWKIALELEPDRALTKKKVTHKTIFYE